MLEHCEQVVHGYLVQGLCDHRPPRSRYVLFAVEGETGVICHFVDSLVQNTLLKAGDIIAPGTPVFTLYLALPGLDRYGFKLVRVEASEFSSTGRQISRHPDSEIFKLAVPRVKAFFLVNPGNPTSVAMQGSCVKRLVLLEKTQRPDLMILTDDAYGTFVEGFRSLMAYRHGTVLLNGSGFAGPDWSVRVSLANLYEGAFEKIGDQLRALLDGVVEQWRAVNAEPSRPRL